MAELLERERQFVINFFQTELDQDSIKEYVDLYDQFSGYGKTEEDDRKVQADFS